MRHTVRALAPLVLPLALAAAGLSGGIAACHPGPREQIDLGATATLRVQNQGFSDMTIYVLRGTQRIRLGLSTGNSTQLFRIPRDVISGSLSLRFIADPVGGRIAPISEEISVRPGDTVTLLIPPS